MARLPPAGALEGNFVESFDTNDNDWPMTSSPDGLRFSVTKGQYQLTIPPGVTRYIRPGALAQRTDVQQDITIAATVHVHGSDRFAVGLGCRVSTQEPRHYILQLSGDGKSTITRQQSGGPEAVIAASPQPVRLPQSAPIKLSARCADVAGRAQLNLTVNGTPTVSALDPHPLPPDPPSIFVQAAPQSPGPVQIAFDDLQVTPLPPSG